MVFLASHEDVECWLAGSHTLGREPAFAGVAQVVERRCSGVRRRFGGSNPSPGFVVWRGPVWSGGARRDAARHGKVFYKQEWME